MVAAATLWGTTGTAQALAPAGSDPLSVGAVRLAVGGLALLALGWARGRLPRLRGPAQWGALAVAGASMAAYQPLFFSGVARTGVAVGTTVAIGSAPLVAGLLGFVLRGERLGLRWLAATLMAVTGCATLSLAGRQTAVDPAGVALAVGAGAAYAVYAASAKGLLDRFHPDGVTAFVFGLAALLSAPQLAARDMGWVLQARGLAVALHLGLVATAAAYFLFARGLQRVSVATAATGSLMEPLTAALLGFAVLGERLTLTAWLGAAAIFTGLLILSVEAAPALATRTRRA